jgi:tRNA-2-methylthio-N6-dimethylallyladenosine synthase
VRFTSPHPKDFREDTIAAMAESRTVCEHIHLPLQSGSDAVLRRMKRAYTRSRYLDKVHKVREAIPNVAITTDIIVGFPGETDAEFEETLSLVEEIGYDGAFTFQYSPRPMTEAAEFDQQVPKEVVQERFDRLLAVQETSSMTRNLAAVGRTEQVLVEGSSKKDASRITGRTRTNKLVHFVDDSAEAGSFRTVEITSASPHHLEGTLVDGPRADAPRSMSLPMIGAAAGCSSCP